MKLDTSISIYEVIATALVRPPGHLGPVIAATPLPHFPPVGGIPVIPIVNFLVTFLWNLKKKLRSEIKFPLHTRKITVIRKSWDEL